jgi:hypothetical protein
MKVNSAGNGKRLLVRPRPANDAEFAPKSHAENSMGTPSAHPNLSKPTRLWAPLGWTTTALAEALVYNELTPYDSHNPEQTSQIKPELFYAQYGKVKYLTFHGGNRARLDMFRKAGLLRSLTTETWNKTLSPYMIRRIGDDPRAWVNQVIDANVRFGQHLLPGSCLGDPLYLEAEVLVLALEYLEKVFKQHTGGPEAIVDLGKKTTPQMLRRINQLYGTGFCQYQKIEVPCNPDEGKPCMRVTCEKCNTQTSCHNTRRFATRGFMYPWYVSPCPPESIKAMWRQPVARAQ